MSKANKQKKPEMENVTYNININGDIYINNNIVNSDNQQTSKIDGLKFWKALVELISILGTLAYWIIRKILLNVSGM